jgi:hypothetical protein
MAGVMSVIADSRTTRNHYKSAQDNGNRKEMPQEPSAEPNRMSLEHTDADFLDGKMSF